MELQDHPATAATITVALIGRDVLSEFHGELRGECQVVACRIIIARANYRRPSQDERISSEHEPMQMTSFANGWRSLQRPPSVIWTPSSRGGVLFHWTSPSTNIRNRAHGTLDVADRFQLTGAVRCRVRGCDALRASRARRRCTGAAARRRLQTTLQSDGRLRKPASSSLRRMAEGKVCD